MDWTETARRRYCWDEHAMQTTLSDNLMGQIRYTEYQTLPCPGAMPNAISGAKHARTRRMPHRRSRCLAVPQEQQLARLCYVGHVLMEDRNGLVVDNTLPRVTGAAERAAPLTILDCNTPNLRIIY